MFIKVGDPQPVLKVYSSKELFKLGSDKKEAEERKEEKEENPSDLEK